MKRSIVSGVSLVLTAILLCGCGQKGPLYIPEPPTENKNKTEPKNS